MPEELDAETRAAIERVEARSEALRKEIKDHTREIRETIPWESVPIVDARLVFEGWAIQKLAGLQVTVEMIGEDLGRIRNLIAISP